MRHAGSKIGPAHALDNGVVHLFALALGEVSSARLNETFHISLRLLFNSIVEKGTNLAVFLETWSISRGVDSFTTDSRIDVSSFVCWDSSSRWFLNRLLNSG